MQRRLLQTKLLLLKFGKLAGKSSAINIFTERQNRRFAVTIFGRPST